MNNVDQLWNSSLEELKRGYIEEESHYVCVLCGKHMEKGIIYSDDGIFYEAKKYMRNHIQKIHQSVFDYLIQLNKRLTGLTDHQKSLLHFFYQGKSDKEIQKEMSIGSASTIRNHRFALKEKERQAKVFLAMMELLKEQDKHAPAFIDVHNTATMVDERYNVTQEENQKILNKFFVEGTQGSLKSFPVKQKQKLIILREIAKRFNSDQKYTEKEVNEILQNVYDDHVTLRRYLVEYGFLDRKPNGSQYWLKK